VALAGRLLLTKWTWDGCEKAVKFTPQILQELEADCVRKSKIL
jgi:hypothetical protein